MSWLASTRRCCSQAWSNGGVSLAPLSRALGRWPSSSTARTRRSPDAAREKLIDLHKETQRYTGPLQLVEPDEEELAWVWAIMEREPP